MGDRSAPTSLAPRWRGGGGEGIAGGESQQSLETKNVPSLLGSAKHGCLGPSFKGNVNWTHEHQQPPFCNLNMSRHTQTCPASQEREGSCCYQPDHRLPRMGWEAVSIGTWKTTDGTTIFSLESLKSNWAQRSLTPKVFSKNSLGHLSTSSQTPPKGISPRPIIPNSTQVKRTSEDHTTV